MTKDKKMKNGDSVKIQKEYTSVKIDVENSKGEVYRYLIILTRKSGKAGRTALGQQMWTNYVRMRHRMFWMVF